MARPGITYDQVADAADSIISQGKRPTINRIRTALGTGSPNTIHRHLTAYRHAGPDQDRKRPELPAELQSAIVAEFERHAAAAVAELKKELMQSQNEASELSVLGEQLESSLDKLTERKQVLYDRCQKLTALAEERAREIDQLKSAVSGERKVSERVRLELAQTSNKLETQDARIKELIAENEKIRSELDQVVAAKAAVEKTAAVAIAKLEATNAQLTERNQALSDECQKLTALAQERAREIDQLKSAAAGERKALEQIRFESAQTSNKVETQDAKIKKLTAENEKIRSELDQAAAAKVEAEQTAAVAVAKLDATNARFEDWKLMTKELKARLAERNKESQATQTKRKSQREDDK